MDSDLPLIEIAGEDDSLIQQIPTIDDTTTTTTYFSFSPLQIRNSNRSTEVLKGGVVVAKPSSLPSSSNNKENINMNKSEVPNLSVEPQQMKRRKKGGGYNLRKSLAWDRAFFTEEGVLDPLELSMLGGNFGNSSGEALSVIHEEGRKSLSGDSECSTDSAALEENSFKEISASPLNEDRLNGGSSLPKHNSSARDNVASTSVAIPKVLPKNSSRTGHKGSVCPRPLASPSLKRPANASTKKAAMKESKLPKLPVSKPGPCSLPTTAKSTVLGASYSKLNQIAQSDNIQTNAGLRGFSKNAKGEPNKAKSGPGYLSAKSSLQHPRRNKANLPAQLNSSTNPLLPLVSKSNVGLVVTPNPVLLPTGMHALDGHDVSKKNGASFPQNTRRVVGNMQYAQLQTTKPSGLRMPSPKPSGLRMPSPSLGFFGQLKSSTSHSLSQRTTQSCSLPKSSIPILPKLGASNYTHELRLPHAPGKTPKVVIDAAASGSAGALGFSMDCAVPSVVNDFPRENMTLNLEVNKVQVVKVACDPESPESVKSNREVHNIIDVDKRFQGHAEPDKVEQISCSDGTKLQTNGDELLSQSGICDQFERENSYKNVTIVFPECEDRNGRDFADPTSKPQHSFAGQVNGVFVSSDIVEHQHIEEKECSSLIKNQGVIFESQRGNDISVIEQDSLTMHNDSLRNTHYEKEQSGDQAELMNPSSRKADQTSHREKHNLKTNGGIPFEDIKPFEQSQKHNSGDILDINPNTQSSSGSEMECSYGPSQHQSTEEVNKDAAGIGNLNNKHVEDVQVHFLDGTSLDESCNSNLNTSAVHTHNLIVDDVYDQSGEHPEPKSSCVLVEQTSQFCHGFRSDGCLLLAENISSEEYQEVNDLECAVFVVLERNDDCGREMERSNVIFNQEPGAMQDGAVDADEMIEQSYAEAAVSGTEEMVPSVEIRDGSIDTQFRHDIKLRSEATLQFDSSLKMSRVNTTDSVTRTPEASKELGSLVPSAQTSLNGSSILEVLGVGELENNIAVEESETNFFSDNPHEENQKIKINDGIFFEENRTFKKSRTGDLKNTGSELSSYIPYQLKNTVYTNEGEARADNMTNQSHMGDSKMYFDNNLLVGSCNSDLSTSAVQTPYLMFVDDANEQFSEWQKLQDPRVVDECVFEGNQVLHSSDYLLLGKSTSFEEHLEENVLESVEYLVSERHDIYGRESQCFAVAAQVSPEIQDGGAGVEKMDEHPHAEDAPSGSVEIKSSAENHKNAFIDTQFRHDVELCDQATSSEFDSALSRSFGVVTTHKAFCSLSEESGLLVQTSSNESSILNVGVDVSKHILPDEIEVKISQNSACPIDKLVVADANELSGEQLMLRNPCIVDECVSQDNHGLYFNDYLLLGESTNSEELQEEKVPENVEHVVPDRSDAYGSESELSNVVAHVSPAIQDSGAGVGKMDERAHAEDAPTASIDIEPSAENHKYAFIDIQFRHDMELCGNSTSSEFDSALRTDETETTDVVSTLNEESGLLVQMLSNENGILAVGVDRIKCTLPDETEVKISQNIVSPVNELVVSDVNEQPMLQNPCIANECVSQDNHKLHFSDYLLLEKSTRSEEQLEDSVPDRVQYVVPERSDAHGSESKSPNVVDQVSPAIQDDATDVEKLDEHPHAEDAPSCPVDIEPSAENHKYSFMESQFMYGVDLCGQATSSESDLALKTSKAQTTDVVTPYKAFYSLSDESGFRTTSNESSIPGIGVDGIERILPDENEVKIPQNIVSPAGSLHRKLDNVTCLTEDDDATKPIKKSENGAKRDNLIIKPPANAIPFSDEWLAAMEAAGEDILTMKSGAVQNSPPDKSVPEPGPWSPVKRKNNELGPYDCTKFTNIAPPDSH